MVMKRRLAAAIVLTTVFSTASFAASGQPTVVELFTSQGCSSCPPADALLGELKRTRPDLLVLDFHVDYWNGLGWSDPFSSPAATERQRHYADLLGSNQVYTPQMVIAGRLQAVGSDRDAVADAISTAQSQKSPPVVISTKHAGADLDIDVGAGQGAGDVLVVGFDDQHATSVGRGENSGRMLTEVNVVRSIARAGRWDGKPLHLALATPKGERIAVILQTTAGAILAADATPVS